ncbi:MAG: nuclear transport factor 2 family protein [Bacteroidota bacterium]
MKKPLLALLYVLAIGSMAFAQNVKDEEAVKQAVLNYVEGFYEGDTSKLVASLHPQLSKYGYYVPRNGNEYKGSEMTYQGALDYALSVKAKQRFAKEGSPKEIELFEVLDQTAVAKLTAWWGIDYLMLAKENGKWMIMKVIWQSQPQ